MARQGFRLNQARLLPAAVCSRRSWLVGLAAVAAVGQARAFEPADGFRSRLLSLPGAVPDAARLSGAARWAWELAERTSAPARLVPQSVTLGSAALLEEPFLVWSGDKALTALAAADVARLRLYLHLGGMLVVDDQRPESGEFLKSAREQVLRALPEANPITLDPGHVLYKTYYMLQRPVGRVLGPARIEAIILGGTAQVLFLKHDLLGALARSPDGSWVADAEPYGAEQREHAIRFAVNIAMYVLCSDYKDDQVHAPWLMRRRSSLRP